MDSNDDLTCPVCLRWFKTKRGCTAHLKNACSCSWYCYSKLADLEPLDPLDLDGEGGEMGMEEMGEINGMGGDAEGTFGQGIDEEADPEDVFSGMEDEDSLFHFIPIPTTSAPDIEIGEAGPGPSTATSTSQRQQIYRALDDEDDSQVEDNFIGAGRVIRMNEMLHEKWKKKFGNYEDKDGDMEMEDPTSPHNSFYPFASELDWCIANWVIKDGPGNNAFDRLLAIPGVRLAIVLLIPFILL
jgi:hypothetical protein